MKHVPPGWLWLVAAGLAVEVLVTGLVVRVIW